MSKIKFVTDSAADIPADICRELDIQVLAFPIAMEDEEFLDGAQYTPQEFYAKLVEAPNIPTHSQLIPIQFQECYEAAWRAGYTDLIYVSINSKGSSTYDNAVLARGVFYAEHPEAEQTFCIHTVDSHTYTMAYGYAVMEGARMARTGAGAAEILTFISDWLAHARILFAPYDLKFAKKSGRVSVAAAFVGEVMGLRPIMTFENGESKIVTKVRGDKNVIPAIVALMQADMGAEKKYLCIKGSLEERNTEFYDSAVAAFEVEPRMQYYIGGVISINAGPNVVGVLYRTD